jgi:pimeloyl-ACP methyl ester carboxylesterase
LYDVLGIESLAALAPQAGRLTWYPNSFRAPLETNQPFLDSALRRVESLVEEFVATGIPAACVAFMGFSQSACLACEFTARHARRYGALIAFTGGLIGPDGTPRDYAGALDGTPSFSAPATLTRMCRSPASAKPAKPLSGWGHIIHDEELDAARRLLLRMVASGVDSCKSRASKPTSAA